MCGMGAGAQFQGFSRTLLLCTVGSYCTSTLYMSGRILVQSNNVLLGGSCCPVGRVQQEAPAFYGNRISPYALYPLVQH